MFSGDELKRTLLTLRFPELTYKSMRRTVLLAIILSVAGLTGVHVYVAAQGTDYAGFLLFLNHLFDITLVLSFLGVCAAVGMRLFAVCHYDFDRSIEALLFAVAIGCGVVATLILILGFLSGLQAITLTAVLLFLALLSKNEILDLPSLIAQSAREIKERSNIFSLILFAVVAVFLISLALLPPTDWDSIVYHLRVPAQFLDKGRIYLPDDNLHTAFVQLVHMLYLPLLAYGSIAGPALLSAFFAVLLGCVVFALANRFFEGQTATFSAALLWANTIVLIGASTPKVDVTLAFYLLLGHFALLRALSDRRYFYLSAILLGLAIGVKQNGLIYALGLSPLIILIAIQKNERLKKAISSLFGFGIVGLAATLPWLIKNWSLFRAPFYPYFAQWKVDPWLHFLYPEKIRPQIVNVYAEMRASFNIFDLLFNPFALNVGAEALFYRFSPLFLCLVLWLIYHSKNKTLNWLMIPALFHFAVTIIFSSKTNLRYLIPVLAPFTIVAVHVTKDLLLRLLSAKKALLLFAGVSLVALLPSASALRLWTIRSTPWPYLRGAISRDAYVMNSPGFGGAVSYVNQNLSSEDRVLMLFEARGFYFNVPVIQDNVFSNWLLLALKASSLNCLENSGISHVLFNGASLDYFLKRGLDPRILYLDEFKQFAENCLTPIYDSHKFVVYQVGK